MLQRLADDSAGARVAAKQARDTLEALSKNRPDDTIWANLALADAVMGEKDSALKAAERAIMLYPSAKDRMNGPAREEFLALTQTIVGENGRAISTLTRLLQTPYRGWIYLPEPVTPLFLGSIRSGTRCATIPLSKNSAKKSRNNFATDYTDNTDHKR